MTSASIPIVWAKLQQPVLPAGAIERQELLESLVATGDATLTVIVAPAGYGKTTTAVQLAARLGRPTAWLSLEPADDDPARFWSYVAASLAHAGVSGVEEVPDLVSSSGGVDLAVAHIRRALEADGRPLLLVLDDVQVIEDQDVIDRLSDLVRRPPANLRIVCTGRHDLPLPVGRLRSEGRLTEARIESLAFAPEEVLAVLRSTFGLAELPAGLAAAVHERTVGWPVGVYLAGLGLRDDDDAAGFVEQFAGDTRHLSEYLSMEAVERLDDDDRAFLLATCVVSTLIPDLCDTLTGQPGSLGILRKLTRENVFTVALTADAVAFRYHPLFQDHLQSVLAEEHPDLVFELNARASAWYEAQGDVDQAIGHAVAAEDPVRARELIAGSWVRFARAGQFGRLEQWVRLLGDAAATDSSLCLMMVWVALNHHRYDEVDVWASRAEAAAVTDADRLMCAVEIPVMWAHVHRHLGDVGSSLDAARQALDHADVDRPVPVGGPPDRAAAIVASALAAAGVAEYWAGDIKSARECLTAAVARGRVTGELSAVVMGYSYLALVEADLGDHDTALAHADQVLGIVDADSERFHLPATAHLARSMALLQLGRPADAEMALDNAARIDSLSDEPLVRAAIAVQRARLRHQLADQAGARAAVREAQTVIGPLADARFDERLRVVDNEVRFAAVSASADGDSVELSEREQAVLALLPYGLSRRDLAAQLYVSENTVKTHLTSIRHKLGLRGRESIVDRARELGLLPEGSEAEDVPAGD